jgi:hypothetical protein
LQPFTAYDRRHRQGRGNSSSYTLSPLVLDAFTLVGYRKGVNDKPEPLHPRFQTSLSRNPGRIEYILDNYQEITKLIRKDTINFKIPENINLIQKFFLLSGLTSSAINEQEIKEKYEIHYTPLRNELEEMINEYLEGNSESKWDDLGFVFQGDTTPKWLSNSLARGKFQLDIVRENREIINTNSLLESLTGLYCQIVSLRKT